VSMSEDVVNRGTASSILIFAADGSASAILLESINLKIWVHLRVFSDAVANRTKPFTFLKWIPIRTASNNCAHIRLPAIA
jgi:hypothetical protein